MHSAPAIVQNTVVSMAWNIKDNILQVMTMLVIMPQSTAPSNPADNLPCALFKVSDALISKRLCLPSGKLKAAKLCPELARAQAQQ